MFEIIQSFVLTRNAFWLTYLCLAAICFTVLLIGFLISRKVLIHKKRAIPVKYFQRFFPHIALAVVLFFLLYPVYLTGGIGDAPVPAGKTTPFLLATYHTLRFFVVEADIQETLAALSRISATDEVLYGIYRALICTGVFLAPFFTVTAIMSVFHNIRSGFRYFVSLGKVHVFSELNEKSFALAESISEENHLFHRNVIVFTDVLKPDDELQYDLQESAENRGYICFRNDLESVHYRFRIFGFRKELNFYLINDDETEKIRHASYVLKKYNHPSVGMYIFSDKVQSKLFLTVKDDTASKRQGEKHKSFQRVVRIDEYQSLIYHDLHENGIRLFETAKRMDKAKSHTPAAEEGQKPTALSERIVIRALIIGFGGYGREMFKALLWFCQMPGYVLDLYLIDSETQLKERLNRDFPELMSKCGKLDDTGSAKQFGDAIYSIREYSGVNVRTQALNKTLEEIPNPTFVFVALGNDEDNVQISIRVREHYKKQSVEPDIETVVYDSNVARRMSYRWPLGGGVEAAYYLFAGAPTGTPRPECIRVSYIGPAFNALFNRFSGLSVFLDQSWALAQKKKGRKVSFTYRVNIRKLYEPCVTTSETEAERAAEEIILYDAKPRVEKRGEGLPPPKGFTAEVWEEDDTVCIRVSLYDRKPSVKEVREEVLTAFRMAIDEVHSKPSGIENFKDQPYRIHMIGDLERFYRNHIIINDHLRRGGKKVDGRWARAAVKSAAVNKRVYEFLLGMKPEEFSTGTDPSIIPMNLLKLDHIYDEESSITLKQNQRYEIRVKKTTERKTGKLLRQMELCRVDGGERSVIERSDPSFYPILLNVFELCKKELEFFCDTIRAGQEARYQFTKEQQAMIARMTELHERLNPLTNNQIRSFETMMDYHDIPLTRDYLMMRKEIFELFPRDAAVFRTRSTVLVDDGLTNALVDYSFSAVDCFSGDGGKCAGCVTKYCHVKTGSRIRLWKALRARLFGLFSKEESDAGTPAVSTDAARRAECLGCRSCPVKCLPYLIEQCKVLAKRSTDNDSYDRHEYNQRSSITKYMHEVLRFRLLRCGYLDDEISRACNDPNFFYFERQQKDPDRVKSYCVKLSKAIQMDPEAIQDLELKKALCTVEHIRWVSYMRTEGYGFSSVRDDMAKTHNNMVQVQYLSVEDIRKDV